MACDGEYENCVQYGIGKRERSVWNSQYGIRGREWFLDPVFSMELEKESSQYGIGGRMVPVFSMELEKQLPG